MQSFNFGSEEAKNTLKVFGWTLASAVVVLLIDFVGMIDMPTEYAFVVPLANTILYALKEFIADNR